jgi:hypothetical protein
MTRLIAALALALTLAGCVSSEAVKWAADHCLLPGDETEYSQSCKPK